MRFLDLVNVVEDWSAVSVHIKRLGAVVPPVDEALDRTAQVLPAGYGPVGEHTGGPATSPTGH